MESEGINGRNRRCAPLPDAPSAKSNFSERRDPATRRIGGRSNSASDTAYVRNRQRDLMLRCSEINRSSPRGFDFALKSGPPRISEGKPERKYPSSSDSR